MASMIDAFRDAFSENLSYLKFVIFAIPVYFLANCFMVGKMGLFYTFAPIFGVLIFGLFTQAIYNVRTNKREVLTLNPIAFLIGLIKTFVVLAPNVLVYGTIGYYISKYDFPIANVPHFNTIFHFIVWMIVGSIILTSYLAFAKFQSIKQGFNYSIIFESCADVLLHLVFLVPQLCIVNALLLGPAAYLFFYFKVPFEHWTFVAYCSCIFVVNVSILANYLAQASTELVKGDDSEYDNLTQLNDISGDSVEIKSNKK